MTEEDFQILTSDKVQTLIEQNLHRNPVDFAMTFIHNDIPTALVSRQIKYLQKAETKLPSWFHARCIIPPVSYEQSSSEITASMKEFSGGHCLDLTCGLGVDAFYFSKKFDQVTALESDPVLAKVARHNFSRLGAANISVIHQDAARFIRQNSGLIYDLIYADPSRRDVQGKRVHDLQNTSPDMVALFPLLQFMAKTILIKLSPLFDIAEAFRLFPLAKVCRVNSVNNECKELLIEIRMADSENEPHRIEAEIFRHKEKQKFVFHPSGLRQTDHIPEIMPAFIGEPDVAFYKARVVPDLFSRYYPQWEGYLNSPDGFFFSQAPPPGFFAGRVFEIKDSFLWKPREVKKKLKSQGIQRINIIKRNFPFSVQDSRARIGQPEGGDDFLLLTIYNGNSWCFLARWYKMSEEIVDLEKPE
ncbi:MAG: rRNA adenine N-6-methyltransferase family protein [Bacteroidia bacterium]